jgi:hypothetical protein
METTFTPGPWIAVDWTAETPFPVGVAVAVQKEGTHDAPGRICELIAQGSGRYSPETTNANAHLIAAAPELLDAVKALIRWVDVIHDHDGAKRCDCEDCDRRAGDVDRARFAMAKAVGQAER